MYIGYGAGISWSDMIVLSWGRKSEIKAILSMQMD